MSHQRAALVLVFALLGALLGNWVLKEAQRGSIELHIDAAIESKADDRFEAYINNDFAKPYSLAIAPGVRKDYVLRNVPPIITTVRIDPTNRAGGLVHIYGLEFRSGEGKNVAVSPEALKGWEIINGSVQSGGEPTAAHFLAAEDFRIVGNVQVNFSRSLIPIAAPVLLKKYFYWIFAISLGGYLLFLSARRSPFASAATIIFTAACLYLTDLVVDARLSLGGKLPDTKDAVGYTNFIGVSKEAEYRAFWFGLLTTVVFGLITGFLLRRRRTVVQFSEPLSENRKSGTWFFFLVLFGFAALSVPDYPAIFATGNSISYNTGFDAQNYNTWLNFAYHGLLPFRDFWYPYSGFFYTGFGEAYPSARRPLLYAMHLVIVYAALGWGVYRYSGFRKLRFIVFFATFAALTNFGFFDRVDRYFLAADTLLLFGNAAAVPTTAAFLLWGAFSGYVFFMEPIQLTYAAPGCLLLLISAVVSRTSSERKTVLIRFGFGCALAALIAGASLAWMSYLGQLQGFIDFYRTVGGAANGGTLPAPLGKWLTIPDSNEDWLMVIVFASLLFSLWHVLGRRLRNSMPDDLLPLGLAFLSVVVFHKQIVRPHIAAQTIGPALLTLYILWLQRTKIEEHQNPSVLPPVWLGFSTAFLCSVVVGSYPYFAGRGVLEEKRAYFASVPKRIEAGMRDAGAWSDLANRYFRTAAYRIDSVPGDRFAEEFRKQFPLESGESIFVLGDDSFLYIVLGSAAPPHINFYNQSLAYCQEETVRWVETQRPKYVVWRDSFKEFDQIPNTVRVPLLFAKVIASYIPAGRIGAFEVLRERAAGETVPIDYWIEKLGVLNLGYIPSRHEQTTSPAPIVDREVLDLKVKRPIENRVRTVPFRIDSREIALQFREKAGVTHYRIPIDRLWPWTVARESGASIEPAHPDEDPVSIVSERLSASQLY